MKRLAVTTALICATLTTLGVLYHLRYIALLLAFAIILAAALRPLVAALVRLRLPRGVALALGYVIIGAAPTSLVILLFPPLANEMTALLDGLLPSYGHQLAIWTARGGGLATLAGWLPPPRTLAGVAEHIRPAVLAGGALHAGRLLLETAASGVLVVMLSISWSVHGEPVTSGLAALIPARHRPLFRRLAADLGIGVGRQVFGEACKSLLALAAVALGLLALGAPYPLLPAALVAVLRTVPIVGLGLSTVVVALAVAPLGLGASIALGVATWLLLMTLHGAVPRFLGARDYNPLLGAFVALLLASAIGPVGLVLAPALAAAVQIVIEILFNERECAPDALATTADVRARWLTLVSDLESKPWTSRKTMGLLRGLGLLLDDIQDLEPLAPPSPPPPAPEPRQANSPN
jgi:predicted PurR-regulated permease PerM